MKIFQSTGGQSIPMLDHYLSPYVALSYIVNIARECKSKFDLSQSDRKELKTKLKNIWSEHKHLMNEPCKRLIVRELKAFLSEKNIEYTEKNIDSILKNAYDDTYDDTFQSMEGLVHNLNTMHSRAGQRAELSVPETWETLCPAM